MLHGVTAALHAGRSNGFAPASSAAGRRGPLPVQTADPAPRQVAAPFAVTNDPVEEAASDQSADRIDWTASQSEEGK